MPLKLYRKRGTPNWYIRGTVRGVVVDESSRTADRSVAETIRAKREWDCLQASIFGRKSTATFLEAAVAYMEAGGERRFLAPLLRHFGSKPLAQINQAATDQGAKLRKRAFYCTGCARGWPGRRVTPGPSGIIGTA